MLDPEKTPEDDDQSGNDQPNDDQTVRGFNTQGDPTEIPHSEADPDDETVDQPAIESKSSKFSYDSSSNRKKRYGRYVIQGTLGSGGFGRVYVAEDEELKRLVALKIPKLSGRSQAMSFQACKREAQTVAALEIPGVVPIYDIGVENDGTVYIVSKYIRGRDLYSLMDRGGLERKKGIELVRDVALTLHRVHLESIIHRDIKPGNILVDEEGVPWVSDFGLALRPTEFGKTQGITGTLRYMSPEQVRGESHLVDGRSDLFSLGVILYELVTGQRPFDGPNAETIQHCIQFVEPKPLRQIDDSITPELERVCLKALSKRASSRYTTGQDFAEDLEHCLAPKPSTSVSLSTSTANVVPRGLRSFRGRDSRFFLNLLPGPRDRDGIPEIVRRWKLWIEDLSPDPESRIGVMYGPSGCGKSSILHAGVLPLIGDAVDVAVLNPSGSNLEKQIHDALVRHSPPTPDDVELNSLTGSRLIAHRRENLGDVAKPLLIVIDQFEKWLLNCSAEQANSLAMMLRQCDGMTTKVLLLVRDDFWTALRRFMAVVDVPLLPDQNCTLVDLFDPNHAELVLEQFGRAHGRIDQDNLTPDQAEFLARGVEGLSQHGKVYPVQLALFAEMVKNRPWNPETLKQLGGVEGIGTQFLEDAFSGPHSPAKHRLHEDNATRVLESLLPETGTDVRTRMRSSSDIQAIAGLSGDDKAFRELMHLLNDELRLISPADRFDASTTNSRSVNSYDSLTGKEEKTFQLSHDFLIPSLREWVARKELGTYRGRVYAQLADQAKYWSSKRAKQFLPNWFEWIKFLIFAPRKNWSVEQKEFMSHATRRQLINTLAGFCVLAVGFVAFQFWKSNQEEKAWIRQFQSARFEEIPSIAEHIHDHKIVDPEMLQKELSDSNKELSDERRVALGMVLTQWDPSYSQTVVEQSLAIPPSRIGIVGEFLSNQWKNDSVDPSPNKALAIDRLWEVVSDSTQPSKKRVAAGQLLVHWDAFSDSEHAAQSREVSRDLAQMLVDVVAQDPTSYNAIVDAFQPASAQIVRFLSDQISVDAVQPTLRASTALNLCISLLDHSKQPMPRELLSLTLEASPWQLKRLVPVLEPHKNALIPSLESEIDSQVKAKTQARDISVREAIRVATAAAILARLIDPSSEMFDLLRHDSYPTLRSTLIHRFSQVDVPVERLLKPLASEPKEDVVAGLMMAVGQYAKPPQSSISDRVVNRVLELAEYANQAETMSSANWLASKWEITDQIKPLQPSLEYKPASRRWRARKDDGIMAVVNGMNVDGVEKVYEIGTKEVSVEQFLKFDPHRYYSESTSRTPDCPMNIVRWNFAMQYCRWLSEQEDMDEDQMCYPPVEEITPDFVPDPDHWKRTGYRLPSVAEWRLACGNRCKTKHFFGDNQRLIEFYAAFGPKIARRCGSLKPNPLGLFDMLGNVQEWTSDFSDDKEMRELCGGSYLFPAGDLDNSTIRSAVPDAQFNSIGFRIARTITLE